MTLNKQNIKNHKEKESGQALVMGAGILFILAIAFMFYMSVQRAYNLANLLDETAELAAQSAAEPNADDIVNGDVNINVAKAKQQAEATVELLASISPETAGTIIKEGQTYDPDLDRSTIVVKEIEVRNPGERDALCEEFNNPDLTSDTDLCRFPIVAVHLSLPHRLFGINFEINTRGVATLGSNSRQPEAIPVALPTPTNIPTIPPIVITVNP